jgi:hypothetical protein
VDATRRARETWTVVTVPTAFILKTVPLVRLGPKYVVP